MDCGNPFKLGTYPQTMSRSGHLGHLMFRFEGKLSEIKGLVFEAAVQFLRHTMREMT